MKAILEAFRCALRSLATPAMLWHLTWPTLAALAIWGVLSFFLWDDALAWITGLFESREAPRDPTEPAPFASKALWFAANAALVLVLVPLIYATALFLVAAVALPLMLERVAGTEYSDLVQRRGGTLAGSLANASAAVALWALAWLATLPLWLIPGMGLALSLVLSAWLNQRAYRYDALMQHADAGEMRALWRAERGRLYALGLATGALAYVPLVNLVAPAYAGLVFVHYCLQALRRLRSGGSR
jgi:uncharacterized protein involved in cysteine biosynthesis